MWILSKTSIGIESFCYLNCVWSQKKKEIFPVILYSDNDMYTLDTDKDNIEFLKNFLWVLIQKLWHIPNY